ncbi:elastin-like [Schistocerca nitens]|uniref:elastin-like n=1 Tax=Schistocerca nitens TaxID=7011 RepID=UPI0021183415|nr:elastin-like [Schistocerca nitens]
MLLLVMVLAAETRGAEDADVDGLDAAALQGLSDLPLDALLRVRRTLGSQHTATEETATASGTEPVMENDAPAEAAGAAGALVGGGPGPKAARRGGSAGGGGYGYGPSAGMMKKGKQKGMADIFQGSVTALAFLAFAGYIVCLVVHAIRSSGGTGGADGGVGGGVGGVGGSIGGVGGSIGGGVPPPALVLQPIVLGGGRKATPGAVRAATATWSCRIPPPRFSARSLVAWTQGGGCETPCA